MKVFISICDHKWTNINYLVNFNFSVQKWFFIYVMCVLGNIYFSAESRRVILNLRYKSVLLGG